MFYVTDSPSNPILGAETCSSELSVIKRVAAIDTVSNKYDVCSQNILSKKGNLSEQDCKKVCSDMKLFEGLGCMDGEVKLRLKDDANPVAHTPRTVPVDSDQN